MFNISSIHHHVKMQSYSCTSGNPAILVSRLSTAASADAEATISQSTSDSTAQVPIVATAVCASVFSARIPAALIHDLKLVFIVFLLLSVRNSVCISYELTLECFECFHRFPVLVDSILHLAVDAAVYASHRKRVG